MSKRLMSALKRRAIAWAGQQTIVARGFAPAHLRPYIHSKVEEKDTEFIIRTYVNRNENPAEKYGSADARAQEYGSGLKARRGKKAKYPIVPKPGNRFLAFSWEIANAHPEQFIFNDKGEVLLPKVNHPGIKAANDGKGYMAPAANEIRRRGRAELKKDVREAILGDIRVSFGKKP